MLRIGLSLSQATKLAAAVLLLSPAAFAQTQPTTTAAVPVRVAEQPAYAPQPDGAAGIPAQPAGPQPMATTTAEPPPLENPRAEVSTFSLVARLGLQAGGVGKYDLECVGNACTHSGFTTGSYDFNVESAFVIGADFMFKLGELFRVGPGLLHTVATNASVDDTSVEAGSITEINFVAEAVPRVSPVVWLVPRLQVGPSLFNASGPIESGINSYAGHCSAAKSQASVGISVSCSKFDNPHLGFNVGTGFGVLFAVSPSVRLRADALYEYFAFPLGKAELSQSGSSLTYSQNVSGSRFLLMGGVEF